MLIILISTGPATAYCVIADVPKNKVQIQFNESEKWDLILQPGLPLPTIWQAIEEAGLETNRSEKSFRNEIRLHTLAYIMPFSEIIPYTHDRSIKEAAMPIDAGMDEWYWDYKGCLSHFSNFLISHIIILYIMSFLSSIKTIDNTYWLFPSSPSRISFARSTRTFFSETITFTTLSIMSPVAPAITATFLA